MGWFNRHRIGRDHARKKGRYYPDWNVLVNYANDTDNVNTTGDALCGFSDWRVPDLEELSSIAHLGRVEPAIDQNYFPNTQSDWYWSSSPNANYTNGAWVLNFSNGKSYGDFRVNGYYVRLVRGGQ